MPEKQSETLNELKKFIELEQLLQSITQESGSLRKHLPVVQQAYELRRRIADDKSAWVDEARKSLEALAAIGLETAKKSLTEPQQSEDTLRSLEEAVDEFYKRWRELFEEIEATMTKACKQLPTSIAQGISRGIRARAIEPTCQAVEEALKRVREFRETIEEEQARETPAGRRKRLDEFCEKHRCTYEDVCTSADVSRSSLYAWLNGKAPVVGARIEHLLDGEIPSQKSGSS